MEYTTKITLDLPPFMILLGVWGGFTTGSWYPLLGFLVWLFIIQLMEDWEKLKKEKL